MLNLCLTVYIEPSEILSNLKIAMIFTVVSTHLENCITYTQTNTVVLFMIEYIHIDIKCTLFFF